MSGADAIPLLELCWQQLRPQAEGGYVMREGGEAVLLEALLEAHASPELARSVHALFEAACLLFETEDSPEAAAAILRVLSAARPRLPLRSQAMDAIQKASERGLDHAIKRAPKLGDEVPEGTLKASSFGRLGRSRV